MPADSATKAPKATKATAARASAPRRVPTTTAGGSARAGTPSTTTPAVPENLERFFPGFEQILMQGVGIALPEVIKLLGGSRAGTPEERDAAAARDIGSIFGMLKPLLNECIPVLIDQVWQLTQTRSREGADPLPDDEAVERFFPALIAAFAPALMSALPGAIQGIAGLFGGTRTADDAVEPIMDEEMTTRFWGPLVSVFVPTIKKVLPQLISHVTGVTLRDIGVSWLDFVETNRLHDGDNIFLFNNDTIDDPNATEIVLELAPHKTWWKGIQIQDGGGGYVDEIGVQDNNKVASVRVPSQVLVDPGGYLLFMKAKAFGAHAGMYRLNCGGLSEQMRGRRVHMFWYAD